MALLADFRIRFPEFVDELDARVQLFLDDAELLMADPSKWLDFYDPAHVYYAAHFLAVALNSETGDSGVMAPISHQEVDDVIIKQAVSSVEPSFDELLSTSYGKRFITYRNMITVGPVGV